MTVLHHTTVGQPLNPPPSLRGGDLLVLDEENTELQTGPAKRNDVKTIEKHIKILQNEEYLADIYALFSKQIIKKHHEL